MAGFIKIGRDIWEDEFFPDGAPFSEREAWIWLISEAAWRPRVRVIGATEIKLGRGQIAASIRFLATRWGWPKVKVGRFLDRLKQWGRITAESGTVATVITICNYDSFSGGIDNSGTLSGHFRDDIGTNEKKEIINTPYDAHERERESSSGAAETDVAVEALDAFNEAAKLGGWPQVQWDTPARMAMLLDRVRDSGGLEGWQKVLAKAVASSHLCGCNERGWTATFDFLITEENYIKLMEGNYDDRNKRGSSVASGTGKSRGRKRGSSVASIIIQDHLENKG